MNKEQFLSTGGAGDAFIVMLKLREWAKQNPDIHADWQHIESNNIKEVMHPIWEHLPAHSGKFSLGFSCGPAYIDNIEKYKKGKTVIPTPVRGRCDFHKKEWPLEFPFLVDAPEEKEYDIVLQASGGINNERTWLNNPLQIANALVAVGRHVTIVGTDKEFSSRTTDPEKILNLVGRTKLEDCFELISRCELFIGMSGLLNYYACAAKVKNIHVIESEKHERMYYHPEWNEFTTGIELASLTNILRVINLRK